MVFIGPFLTERPPVKQQNEKKGFHKFWLSNIIIKETNIEFIKYQLHSFGSTISIQMRKRKPNWTHLIELLFRLEMAGVGWNPSPPRSLKPQKLWLWNFTIGWYPYGGTKSKSFFDISGKVCKILIFENATSRHANFKKYCRLTILQNNL